ncbi:transposase [Achromobacter sp. NPDC058515]|uniref:REP-associated tyrosine transposase n=1 Tax=Achromobacter sp. NPDC058515 TaxID=3346533 RepID=UPI00364FFEE6
MARPPRILVAHQPHHVVQRGHRQQVIFSDPHAYRAYLDDLHSYRASLGVALHAWCLMPNHVHLLLTPGDDPRTVSVLMQRVARQATRRWNLRRDTAGSLWEARFKSRLIDSEQYLLECCRYIELNPVRAGLCESASDYSWSSYQARMGLVDDATLDFHELYLAIGADQEARRKAYAAWCLTHPG